MTLIKQLERPGRFSNLDEIWLTQQTVDEIKADFKEDVKDIRDGRTQPWSEVKKELGL
jgi:hypothetical protein